LENLAQRLQKSYPVRVEVLVADLSQHDSLRMVEKRIADESALEMLINNAGFGGYMPFVELDPDKVEDLINEGVGRRKCFHQHIFVLLKANWRTA
jgi:short-subunit dehydrogenase